jgi:hypothetical protein
MPFSLNTPKQETGYSGDRREEAVPVEVTLAVIAEKLNSREDGTLDILGVMTGLRVTTVPYVAPRMNLFISFSANPIEVGTEKVVEVQLLAADGEIMRRVQTTITVPDPPRSGSRADFNVIFPLTNVPFIKDGDYGFHILVESVERTVPFHISVEKGET